MFFSAFSRCVVQKPSLWLICSKSSSVCWSLLKESFGRNIQYWDFGLPASKEFCFLSAFKRHLQEQMSSLLLCPLKDWRFDGPQLFLTCVLPKPRCCVEWTEISGQNHITLRYQILDFKRISWVWKHSNSHISPKCLLPSSQKRVPHASCIFSVCCAAIQ